MNESGLDCLEAVKTNKKTIQETTELYGYLAFSLISKETFWKETRP